MQTLLSKIAGAGLTVMIMGLAGSASATLIVNAVGVYDSLANPNNVDYNATYSAGTGGATAANVTTASTGNGASYTTTGPFNAAVASAFAADRGGVIDWENTSGSFPDLTVKYGTSQTLTLAITTVGPNGIGPGGVITPISGSQRTGGNTNPQTFNFTPGLVAQFGLTVLSRDSTDFGVVTGTATFSGGGTVSATRTISEGAGVGDTFYGFVAPAGQSITGVSFTQQFVPDGKYLIFDDVGFIIVPEPSVLWLLGSAAGLALLRRQRKP